MRGSKKVFEVKLKIWKDGNQFASLLAGGRVLLWHPPAMRFSFILPKGASLFVLCMFSLYLVCPSFLVSHFHTPAGLVLIHLLLVMFLRPSIINLSKTDTLCTWTLKLDKINFSPPRLGKQRGEISRVDVRLDEWRMLKTTKGKAEKQTTIRRHGGAERDWMWLQYSYYHCISNTAKVPQCFTAWGRILQYASQHVFLATLTQILHQ